jgi:putative colanic acid biosynthesis acetyltransferase WcaF
MLRTDLSSFDNRWYKPGHVVKRILWMLTSSLFFAGGWCLPSFPKVWLLRCFGARIGKGVIIKPRVLIKYPWLLTIGNHVWIGEKVWIENHAEVIIKDHCCLSQGAMLLCGNHDYSKTTFDLKVGSIILEEGVWIGARAVVCPGITCGSHAVLTVNSVATRHLEPYSIYQGNPAVKVRDRIIHQ